VIRLKAMKFSILHCIEIFCFIFVTFQNGNLTSIMNDVHIKENELRPPTLLNQTSNVDKINTNETLGDTVGSAKPTTLGLAIPIKNNHSQNDNDVIGSTTIDLPGLTKMTNEETLLGNTVADAFLMNSWDDTEISVMNSSLVFQKAIKKGNITRQMVNKLFPYGTTIDRVVISGTGLLKIFHASVASQKLKANKISKEEQLAHFQVSGIKVTFDNNPDKPTVESIKTACKLEKDCSPIEIKKWCQLNVTRNYTVAITSDLVGKNGKGVGIFKGLILDREAGDLDSMVFSNYITECSPMKQALTGRMNNHHDEEIRLSNSNDSGAIQIKNDKTENQTSTEMKSNARRNEFSFTSFEMLTLIFVSVFFKCFIH